MKISPPTALAALPAARWKNGSGSTRTLAVTPTGSDLDHFLWRVSLADVTGSGSFSRFAGVDRTIMLWSGAGMNLRGPDWSHLLEQRLVPFDFRGEDEVDCDVVAGPTVDLNIMVRRGLAESSIQVAHETVTVAESVETMIVLCAAGQLKILSDQHLPVSLEAGEFVQISDCVAGTSVSPAGMRSTLVAISLRFR